MPSPLQRLRCRYDGDFYLMDLSRDRFVHFTTRDRAAEIMESGRLLMRPPYKEFGIDAVAAVSTVWGSFLPGVQTTHIDADKSDLVGVVFQTKVMPEVGYPEEVLWKQDVVLVNPKVVPYAKAKGMIRGSSDFDGQVYYEVPSWCDGVEGRVASRYTPAESAAISLIQDAPDESVEDLIEQVLRARRLFDPVSRTFVDAKEVAEALRGMAPEPYKVPGGVSVYHATDASTARLLTRRGFIPQTKPRNLTNTYAPGRGIDRGLYVGATPRSVEGYGRVTLEVTVPRKHLSVPTELTQLGETSPMEALKSHDGAVINYPIPAEAFRVVRGRLASPTRVASRFVRAGLLQPPPKLVEAATKWAQATFADRAYQNAKAKEAEFKRTGAGIIGGRDTLDQWFKAMRSWDRLPAGRRGSEVSTLFNLADYLDGWRYRHLFDDAPEGVEVRPIKVTNAFEHGRPGAHGAWSDKRNELQVWQEADVWAPEVVPILVEKHDKIIPKVVRHELQHATQRLIGALTGMGHGGLPTRTVRQPLSVEEQQRRQQEDNAASSRVTPSTFNSRLTPQEKERQERYYRSDLEYQTSLTDAVKEWENTVLPPVERWLDETDLSDRLRSEIVRWLIRTYVGEEPLFPPLPQEFKQPDWQPEVPDPAVFFERIKGDRRRWQEAVSTFYKEVSRTTRLASWCDGVEGRVASLSGFMSEYQRETSFDEARDHALSLADDSSILKGGVVTSFRRDGGRWRKLASTNPPPTRVARVSPRIKEAIEDSMANLPERLRWEIDDFAAGVLMGKAPSLEQNTSALYKAFAPLRKALGGTTTMYRGQPINPPKIDRKWLSWTTEPRMAARFTGNHGDQIIEAKVKSSDVVAGILSPRNPNYIEFLVKNRPEYQTRSQKQVPIYYALYMPLNLRFYDDMPENFSDLSDREQLEFSYPGWKRWLDDNERAVERAGGLVMHSDPPKYDDSAPFLGVLMPSNVKLPPALAALDDAKYGRPMPRYMGKVARHLISGLLKVPPKMLKGMRSWVQSNLDRRPTSRYFPFDLDGWRYLSGVRPEDAEAILKKKHPRGVRVTLSDKKHRFGEARWDDDAWEITIYDTSDLDHALHFVRHEAQHMAQDMLAEITGVSDAGLPKRRIRTPEWGDVDLSKPRFMGPSDPHALIDREYQTRLTDSVENYLRFEPHLSPKAYMARDSFFTMLRAFAPKKYRDAVGKFVAEVGRRTTPRVASRYMQAGLLQPPPKMVDAITAWAEANAAATRLKAREDDDTLLSPIAENELREIARRGKGEAVPYNSGIAKKFPIDLQGWKYGDRLEKLIEHEVKESGGVMQALDERRRILQDSGTWDDHKDIFVKVEETARQKLNEVRSQRIRVVLKHVGSRRKGGDWSPALGIMTIFITPYSPLSEIRQVVKHELTHLAQDLLTKTSDAAVKNLHKNPSGLPSRKIRTPWYKAPYTSISDHSMNDREFYPKLADAVDEMRVALDKLPPEQHRDAFKKMVGEKRGGGSGGLRLLSVLPFFLHLSRADKGKWRKAVSVAYGDLFGGSSSRVASRFVQAGGSFPEMQSAADRLYENGVIDYPIEVRYFGPIGSGTVEIQLLKGHHFAGRFYTSQVSDGFRHPQSLGLSPDCLKAYMRVLKKHPYTGLWVIHWAFLNDKDLFGHGLGRLAYEKILHEAGKFGAVVAPDWCATGGSTSPMAERVWASVAKRHPTEGPLVVPRNI